MPFRSSQFTGNWRYDSRGDLNRGSNHKSRDLDLRFELPKTQPAPKYHTKGCSHSFVNSPGARTLVFAALEPILAADFGRQ